MNSFYNKLLSKFSYKYYSELFGIDNLNDNLFSFLRNELEINMELYEEIETFNYNE
jgi:hypothetical protein